MTALKSFISYIFKPVNYRIVRKMSNKPEKSLLYGDIASPPVRSVMITASILGTKLDFHHVDLFKAENRTEFYKKINPLCKVPTMLIDGQVISDSHVICMYLCRRVNNQRLYPENNMIRARVDQMLYFNATTLFPIDSAIYSDYFAGVSPIDERKIQDWYSALDYLESKLEKYKWLSADEMYLCDICCAVTLTSLTILIPPLQRHLKLMKWIEKLNAISSFDINKQGLTRLQSLVNQYRDSYH